MEVSNAVASVTDANALRLDAALALLRQAGQWVPPGDPSSPAFLQSLIDQLVDLSSRDALTGLANRRSFALALARELDRVARSGEQALLLMVDIDHFKLVNDRHGHGIGDAVIRKVGQVLAETVRPMDLVARIGGEEFVVALPLPVPAARHAAERLLRVIGEPVRTGVAVTASVGVAACDRIGSPRCPRPSPDRLLRAADAAMYRAKRAGGDRVVVDDAVPAAGDR